MIGLLVLSTLFLAKFHFHNSSHYKSVERKMENGDDDDGFQVVGPARRDRERNKKNSSRHSSRESQHKTSRKDGRKRPENDIRFPAFLNDVKINKNLSSTPISRDTAIEYGWTPEEAMTPCVLILVGLVGSGKSTWSQKLESLIPQEYIRISQDELGSRPLCLEKARSTLSQAVIPGSLPACPVVDRCHVSRSQRAFFVDVAKEFDNIAVDCIWFQTGRDECLDRCRQRRNHPTLPPKKAPMVLGAMQKEFQEPLEKEGFRFIHKISCQETFLSVLQLYINRVAVMRLSLETTALEETCLDENDEKEEDAHLP